MRRLIANTFSVYGWGTGTSRAGNEPSFPGTNGIIRNDAIAPRKRTNDQRS